MAKYRQFAIITCVFIILCSIALQFTVIQQVTARLSATIFVTFKYNQMNLEYQQVEYSPQFGSFMVSYKDNESSTVAFEVRSRRMPFIVTFDPLDI